MIRINKMLAIFGMLSVDNFFMVEQFVSFGLVDHKSCVSQHAHARYALNVYNDMQENAKKSSGSHRPNHA